MSAAGYGLGRVVRAEWTKIRSVRSTAWSLVALVVVSIGIGVLVTLSEASNWSHATIADRVTFDPTSSSLTGLLFGQLAIGVLGVLVMSAEYGTGTIRATLAAVPRRPLVLVAKSLVFAAVALVVGEVVSFVAFFVGQSILAGSAPHAAIGQPGVLRAVVGGGLYIAVLGLLALGLAALVRHTAGAITAFVGVLLILPLIVQALPGSVRDAIGKFLPVNIGATLMTVHQTLRTALPSFSPWAGFAILCGYTAVALVLGGIVLVRRDA